MSSELSPAHDSNEHVTQSSEEDTLPKQSVQDEGCIMVNTKNTPTRTGKNLDTQSSDYRKECERKKLAANWGEDAVHLFEGSAVNVWQALAKLSKQCTNWPRARSALEDAKRSRVQQLGSSGKLGWTKTDVALATESLDLCNAKSDDSVTNGHPEKTPDRSSPLKRPNDGQGQSTPYKRQLRPPDTTINIHTVTDDEAESLPTVEMRTRPLWVPEERGTSRILGRGWWNDAVMFRALQFLQTLFDPHTVRFLDPILVSEPGRLGMVGNDVQFPLTGFQRLPISPTAQLLFPLCVADEHWVAVRVRPGRGVVDIFDSKLNPDYFLKACVKVRSFYRIGLKLSGEPKFIHTAPVPQGNNTDCGPIAMLVIIYCAFDKTIDANVDVDHCRHLFYNLLCEDIIDVEQPAKGTLPSPSQETVGGNEPVVVDPEAIEDYLDKLGRLIRRQVAPSSWTEEGLRLVSMMQNAASTQADVPSEVLAGLKRALEYLERKRREERRSVTIDCLLKMH